MLGPRIINSTQKKYLSSRGLPSNKEEKQAKRLLQYNKVRNQTGVRARFKTEEHDVF